ncbi:MAG: uracil-DNA glycosylase family protein [Flavobacteriales bacterium]|nr:uracil-DNA glycosylase family protein [Flavobacteriales bacterium]
MDKLLAEIRACRICEKFLPNQPNPILMASASSKIAIVGQAPGQVVDRTGIPWDDKSGERLRTWLGVSKNEFYDPALFALIPMGFCYPGKGKSGDLPPRKECAPAWHSKLFSLMPKLQTIILIGAYAQHYYLQGKEKKTLTETVKSFQEYLPKYFVLPHPSPRNNIWLRKNEWFEKDIVPNLKRIIAKNLSS